MRVGRGRFLLVYLIEFFPVLAVGVEEKLRRAAHLLREVAHPSGLGAVLDEEKRLLAWMHEVAEFEFSLAPTIHDGLGIEKQHSRQGGTFLVVGGLAAQDLPFRKVPLQRRNVIQRLLCPRPEFRYHFIPSTGGQDVGLAVKAVLPCQTVIDRCFLLRLLVAAKQMYDALLRLVNRRFAISVLEHIEPVSESESGVRDDLRRPPAEGIPSLVQELSAPE